MMKFGHVFVVMALLLCGCGTVYSPVLVGEPVDLSGQIEEWEGIWIRNGENRVAITVVDAERGLLRATSLGPEDDDVIDVSITEYDDVMFVHQADDGDEEDGEAVEAKKYIWGYIMKDEYMALIWAPDAKKFAALVESGVLPGTVDYGMDYGTGATPSREPDVYLDPLDTRHLDYIVAKTNDPLFVGYAPIVFMRVDHLFESIREEVDPVVTNDAALLEVGGGVGDGVESR
jgi:hypothetical protein